MIKKLIQLLTLIVCFETPLLAMETDPESDGTHLTRKPPVAIMIDFHKQTIVIGSAASDILEQSVNERSHHLRGKPGTMEEDETSRNTCQFVEKNAKIGFAVGIVEAVVVELLTGAQFGLIFLEVAIAAGILGFVGGGCLDNF